MFALALTITLNLELLKHIAAYAFVAICIVLHIAGLAARK